ncbi:MAG: formate/nitrite transporter family protein [Dehalococcoidia bacterium]|jgi:formate/nitrite transporter FocA (FNT family)
MPFKSPKEIAEAACSAGTAKTQLPWSKMLVLGVLAGAYIAFGAQLAETAAAGTWAANFPGLQKLIFGGVFPVGLMLVVIAGSELFTGNCAIPVISCMSGKAKITGLLKNWLFVYIGNFIGALIVAYLLAHLSGLFGKTPWHEYAGTIAQAKCSLSWDDAFLRGIGCNWLVCLAVWMAISSDSIIGKVWAIWWPIMAFVAMGFEHSVANMFFIPLGIFENATYAATGLGVTWADFIVKNLIPVTLGNIVGAAIFVSGAYWFVYLRTGKQKPQQPVTK